MQMNYDDLPARIIGAAISVHKELGPGLLESTYRKCLVAELVQLGLKVEIEKEVPVFYKGTHVDCAFRIDILVEDSIVLEVKAVEKMHPVFIAQVITYLKLSKLRIGYLLNFNVRLMRDGIERIVYDPPRRS
jgi:GxxExxY protein